MSWLNSFSSMKVKNFPSCFPTAILYTNQIIHSFSWTCAKILYVSYPVCDKNCFSLLLYNGQSFVSLPMIRFLACRLYHKINISLLAQVEKSIQMNLIKSLISWLRLKISACIVWDYGQIFKSEPSALIADNPYNFFRMRNKN